VRSLRDPLAKMSKSDPIADARILLDDTPDVIRRKVSRSVTDARRDMTYDPEDRPGVANLLGILAALRSEIAAREGEPGTELYVFRPNLGR
jgi:tryptophanyl-tRNA synthetase